MSGPPQNERSLEQQIFACAADLGRYLPQLAQLYSPVAVMGALATHVGGGLKAFMQSGVCTPDQARIVLERVERTAFDRACAGPDGGPGF